MCNKEVAQPGEPASGSHLCAAAVVAASIGVQAAVAIAVAVAVAGIGHHLLAAVKDLPVRATAAATSTARGLEGGGRGGEGKGQERTG